MQHRSTLIVAGALVLGVAAAAVAGPMTGVPSRDAIQGEGALDLRGDRIAGTPYSTGFEAADGFVPGPVEPQAGWTASGVNLPWVSISVANPFAGTQHLRVIRDVSVAAGTQRVALGPNQGALPPSNSSTTVQVLISNDGGADYDIVGQAPSAGFVTWRVKFHFADAPGTGNGRIFVLDNPGTGVAFFDTGIEWTPGAYKLLKVNVDIAANTILYYYDGQLIYDTAVWSANRLEQFVVVTDNFQLAGEVSDIDNLTIADSDPTVGVEPTSWTKIKQLMQ